ncbi:MAG: DUF4230 domain-containing protein [Bacteroidetes bacterium]|nr:DUF4230 domain-containing protein [Bacteroidota bacterium]
MERVRSVLKLATVEAELSNIYTYEEFKRIDISPLRKKAIVKVNAKILVGYDLEKINYSIDTSAKVITINSMLVPEVLAIDTDLSYYDIKEGCFNSFSEAELTKLNTQAKERVKTEIYNAEIINTAAQADELFITLQDIVSVAGWRLKLSDEIIL